MRTNWKRIMLVASVTALSALMVFAGAAFAMGNGPGNGRNAGGFYGDPPQGRAFGNGATATGYGMGVRGAWAGGAGSLVEAAAQVIGVERVDLVAELSEGISIGEAAASHGVGEQEIVDAYLATRSDFVAQAVEAGRLTQEQADLVLAEMDNHAIAELDAVWTAQQGPAKNGHNAGGGFGGRNSAPGRAGGQQWLDQDGDGQCDNCDGTMQGQVLAGGRGGRWNH